MSNPIWTLRHKPYRRQLAVCTGALYNPNRYSLHPCTLQCLGVPPDVVGRQTQREAAMLRSEALLGVDGIHLSAPVLSVGANIIPSAVRGRAPGSLAQKALRDTQSSKRPCHRAPATRFATAARQYRTRLPIFWKNARDQPPEIAPDASDTPVPLTRRAARQIRAAARSKRAAAQRGRATWAWEKPRRGRSEIHADDARPTLRSGRGERFPSPAKICCLAHSPLCLAKGAAAACVERSPLAV